MSEYRSLLSPTRRDRENEMVKISVKDQKNIVYFLKLIEK